MPDEPQTTDDALDEGALLDAYLDGETDDITTARLDRRLAVDRELAARLDTLADTRARLQRLSEVSATAQSRRRLDAALRRARADATRDTAPETAARDTVAPDAPARPRRRWRVIAPAAAAIVVLAALGLTGVLGPFGMSEEALITTGSEDGGDAADAAGGVELEAAAGADREPGAEADAAGAPAVTEPTTVTGDAQIATRARRLRDDPPASLAAREQRLRDAAGLSSARLCVAELEAATVDLIDDGGRVALAVLVEAADQVVLLDPRTCATIRTVPAGD